MLELSLGIILGGFIIVIVLKYLTYKDGKKSICENKEIVEELKKNKNKLKELLQELELLEKETRKKEIEQYDLKSQNETIEHKIQTLNDLYEHKKKTVSESLKDVYDAYKISAEENLNRSLEEAALNYQKAQEEYQKEYLTTLEETQKSFTDLIINRQEELEEVVKKLNEAKESYQALIKVSDNKYNIEDFTLQISPEDLVEIEKLREVIPYLRDPEALNKVIWAVYYQKPYQDLIVRLFGAKKHVCGIYKITYLKDGLIYIGQSVDIQRRFSEHIKRGLGAEPSTKNKLYVFMKKVGVENFSFELLEEVPKEELNKKEKYWIDFYQSDIYGLNGTKGNNT